VGEFSDPEDDYLLIAGLMVMAWTLASAGRSGEGMGLPAKRLYTP